MQRCTKPRTCGTAHLAHALQQWLDVILDYDFTIKHRPGVLHVLPDALSRMYEVLYTSAWGVPVASPSDVIQQQLLPVDNMVLHEMSQQPSPPVKAKARMVSLSSVSPSRGGESDTQIEITFNASNANTDNSITYVDGLPRSQHLMVRKDAQGCICLFALAAFEPTQVIHATAHESVFYPYTRSAAQGNARRIVDPDIHCAHLLASKPIKPEDEIIITHRSIIVRAASVNDQDVDMDGT